MSFGDPVSEEVKQERYSRLTQLQERVGTEKNDELVGSRQQVLVDARVGEACYGRMERDAPEIDGQVVITEGTPPVGSFVEVEITDGRALRAEC